MTNPIILSGLVVGVLAILFFTPALMAMGISKLESGEISFTERLICCVPILNLIRAEWKYYGKPRLISISTIILILGVAVRVYLWRNFYSNVTIGTVSIIIFWGVIALWIICNMVFVYTVINDAQALTGAKLVFYSVFFPFGQYFVGSYLVNIIRHMRQKEETFKV